MLTEVNIAFKSGRGKWFGEKVGFSGGYLIYLHIKHLYTYTTIVIHLGIVITYCNCKSVFLYIDRTKKSIFVFLIFRGVNPWRSFGKRWFTENKISVIK